jgi:hypothetical protein
MGYSSRNWDWGRADFMPQFPKSRTVFKGLKYAEIWELTYKEQFYNFD